MSIDLSRIKRLAEELEQLKPIKSESQQELDKKFRLEFNYNSNHLEGNTLTYDETQLLLMFDDAKGDHTLRELEEMKGSDVALLMIKEWATDKERPLSEQKIKNLNELILVRPFWKEAITLDNQQTRRLIKVGEYKEHPNSVRLANGELFEYTSPIDTPIKMGELIQWYREEEGKKELHPIILAALLHYKYVCIHPFDDGNGRISRLLMNYVLIRNNFPPIVIKSSDKRNYLTALNRADTGDIDSFVKYIADQFVWSLELSIKAAKGLSLNEPGDLHKKIDLFKLRLNSANEEIKIFKSSDSVSNVYENSIEPLFKEFSKTIGKLDSLFKSKEETIIAGNTAFGFDRNSENPVFKGQLKKNSFAEIGYRYQLLQFRKGPKQFSVSTYFKILFHNQVYELISDKKDLNISKLYHETFTLQEIESIIDKFGTELYNNIEVSMQ